MKTCFVLLWMLLSQIMSVLGQNCSDVCLMWGNHTWQGVVASNATGQWRAVCDDKWDHDDAMVVCRQMGYSSDHAVALEGVDFADVVDGVIIWLDDVECLGTETSLTDCEAYRQNQACTSGKYARVMCPSFTDIRVVGGEGSWTGRVEVKMEGGEWGTVCDDLWNDQDAAVVCRQLGYNTTNVTATHKAVHGEGSGSSESIFLDNMQCEGTEAHLWDCPGITNGLHNCRHSEDAGVNCGGGPDPTSCENCNATEDTNTGIIIGVCAAAGVLVIVSLFIVCKCCCATDQVEPVSS